jgi:O-acetyl-ADP-ribose deacetylase (regulator of RNase III)
MSLKIVRNDITKMNTEAIVNTANDHVTVGTGCDYAVYMEAGYDELLKYREENIGFVPEGDAFITPGFKLHAKYIIHAVSPLYLGGNQGEESKLRSCYKKCLQLAKENNIKSIAFPLISTGGFGYPIEEGMRIAVDEINAFLLGNEMDIYLVVFDSEVWKRAIVDKKVFSKIKNNPNYHPKKITALCLCVGAKLNLDESKDLLARAGYALSPCDKTDIIFSYFIENEIYDMIELDIQLEEHGLPCIIS